MSVGSNPAFPIIHVRPYTPVINNINISISRKILRKYVFFTKKNFMLIKILYKIGLVKNYTVFSKSSKKIGFTVFFYKLSSFYSHIRLVSTGARNFSISLSALKKLNAFAPLSLFILSTSKGIITHNEALKYGIGGKILCIVS